MNSSNIFVHWDIIQHEEETAGTVSMDKSDAQC